MKTTDALSEFGVLLYDYRKRAGLTQLELADLSTVSVRAIRDLELGRAQRPRNDTVDLLAEALRLSGERRALFEISAGRDSASAVFQALCRSYPTPPPGPSGPIIGRDGELRNLRELIEMGSDRLISVSGIPGVGKTRLALALAHNMHRDNRLPIIWVPAPSEIHLPSPLAHLLQHSIDIPARWIRKALSTADSAIDKLIDLIAERTFLIIIDEHDRVSINPDTLTRMLWQCPNLTIVTTTRSPCAHPSERPFPLRPLAVPELNADPAAADNPAAEVLSWYIRSHTPSKQTISQPLSAIFEICWRLDGIPLALQAAASWTTLMSPPRLAELARTDPFQIVSPLPHITSPSQPLSALSEIIADLPPETSLMLNWLSSLDHPWSIDEVIRSIGETGRQVPHVIHALLTYGLIRPVDTSSTDTQFVVLNLVRHLCQDFSP
jgi:transcriptional regulator with XRE-family HTH domain